MLIKEQLIVFDVGRVIVSNFNVVPTIAKALGITEEDFYRLAGEDNLYLLYCGDISTDLFWERFSRSYRGEITEDLWEKYYRPQLKDEVIEKIEKYRDSNRVVAGTNTVAPHYRINDEKGIYRPFEKVYASSQMGLAKPQPEFYEKILSEEGYKPSETVFIDDKEINIESARKLGINTVLFRSISSLEESELLSPGNSQEGR